MVIVVQSAIIAFCPRRILLQSQSTLKARERFCDNIHSEVIQLWLKMQYLQQKY
ncbi:hypothetical protein MiYa_04505 [Microcystis aeruginosa NIES-2519]|uniref:Uncharacterized protein n=1 Tax=Microcystis aeruginosa NIES-2519 TaxID=2303981 RepID=A0A5A5RAB4_MICAE|nr:hypothetical protein [Microcystis sp. M049S2]MCA2658649.1 hypothetical protein [Microcystis sp. M049S2]GCA72950.1 hypothetical protein MiYa_04505 [Microcystis aeruginosa NIES-2519]GCA84879.1 hypothetical protein MiHa_02854 [Microcystis aeruginosa NIES-2522]